MYGAPPPVNRRTKPQYGGAGGAAEQPVAASGGTTRTETSTKWSTAPDGTKTTIETTTVYSGATVTTTVKTTIEKGRKRSTKTETTTRTAATPSGRAQPPKPAASSSGSAGHGVRAPARPSAAAAHGGAPQRAGVSRTGPCTVPLDELPVRVLEELNNARTDPRGFAQRLKRMDAIAVARVGFSLFNAALRGLYEGKKLKRQGRMTIATNEGLAALDEAIAVLESQPPLPPLGWSRGLAAAAADHAADQARHGGTGHNGSDGSTMRQRIERHGSWSGRIGENIDYGHNDAFEIVTALIVDDGVPSRGHRNNIYNAGVSCSTHPQYEYVCVQDFATQCT